MRRTGTMDRTVFTRKLSNAAALLALLVLSGCATTTPTATPPAEAPVVEVPAEIPPPADPPKPKPAPVPPPVKLPPVTIVMTGQQAAYADVARELAEHFDDYQLFDLSDTAQPPVAVLATINDSPSKAVIAIGLRAAQSSVAMSKVPVIFSQVFNFQDHNLVTDNSRGVAPLAPMDLQLAGWLEVEPDLTRVGLIVGQGHDDLVDAARKAALEQDVQLRVQIAQSDQETVYLFRRMAHDIDGFWLMPDNRILSGRALNQIIETANRHGVSVAVPNELMLDLGAQVSLSAVAADVAQTIADLVEAVEAGQLDRLPGITDLSDVKVIQAEVESTDASVADAGEQP